MRQISLSRPRLLRHRHTLNRIKRNPPIPHRIPKNTIQNLSSIPLRGRPQRPPIIRLKPSQPLRNLSMLHTPNRPPAPIRFNFRLPHIPQRPQRGRLQMRLTSQPSITQLTNSHIPPRCLHPLTRKNLATPPSLPRPRSRLRKEPTLTRPRPILLRIGDTPARTLSSLIFRHTHECQPSYHLPT